MGDAISGLQWCAVQLGQVDRAIAVAERYAKLFPTSPIADDLLMRVGDLLFNLGDFNRAAEQYEKMTLDYPRSELVPAAIYWRGRSLEEAGDTTGALDAWSSLIKRNGRDEATAQALFRSGRLHLAKGDTSTALKTLADLREKISQTDIARDARLLEGTILRIRGNSSLAVELLQPLAEEKSPDLVSHRAAIEIARAYCNLGKLEQAFRLVDNVANKRADEVGAEAQFETGVILEKLGRNEQALDAYLKVKYIFGAYSEWVAPAVIAAARLQVAAGETNEARRLLEQLKRDHGEDEWGKKAGEMIKGLP